jgi:hypothetical protein
MSNSSGNSADSGIRTEIQNINEIKPRDEPLNKTEKILLDSFFPLKKLTAPQATAFGARTILVKVIIITILASIIQSRFIDKILEKYKLGTSSTFGIKIGMFSVICFAVLYFG